MKKFFGLIWKHKIYTLIILALVGVGGYFGYKKWFVPDAVTRYVTAKVERGVLVSSISGSGQVSASNQVDIQPKASGDVLSVSVKAGQEVKAGALLVQLNASAALKAVRDASSNLESTRLSLEKLTKSTDALTLLQYENSLAQAQESKTKAEDDLAKAYEDGFNNVANAFLDLPSMVSGLYDILYGYTFDYSIPNLEYYANNAMIFEDVERAENYRNSVSLSYSAAKNAYDINFDSYKAAGRFSSTSTIEDLIDETYETTKLIAEAIKNANNLVQYYTDVLTENKARVQSQASNHLSTLNGYTGTTNSQLITLLAQKRTIQTDKESIVNSERTIAEKTVSLADLKAGTDPLDIQAQQITLRQRQNSLSDARETLSNYSVRAPFDGVIAAVNVKKGDAASSGSAVCTIITKQRVATIALNEVDVAKVKAGQKAVVTFDAVEDLSITGEVVEVDAIGAVSQGVVSYNVKVAFDIQDERVKPGMSVSVSIILSSKPDVLLVSSSAIKTQNGSSYAEVMVSGTPQKMTITVGDSNDTMTEVVSGLSEGDEVVTQTVTGAGTASAAAGSAGSQSANRGAPGGMMFGEMH
ncbi:MAG: efflux RND transporter periplasmic adaptor subunit [Candidatus Magasanikbacteria bacterium]|nr:efflux RND transporter periplasmic adaptor subunit [Candidatus Magasanikbacteria bacterium]